MPTNTYVALDKVTVGTATPSITFTGINQGYTDLVLVLNGRSAASQTTDTYVMQFNGDSGTNYSRTRLLGNGSAASSANRTNAPNIDFEGMAANTGASGVYGVAIVSFQSYAKTTVYKTVLIRGNDTNYVEATVGMWQNTAAISSITLATASGANLMAGSTFSLYGIRAEGVSPAPKATGGAIYSDSTYYYHVFGSTGTFTPLSSLTADVLVVAGGGGGGTSNRGGGGGAGGVIYFAGQSLSATGYTCTVGAGGGGYSQGTNSQFASLTVASGGGYGGHSNFGGTYLPSAGGSGGGIGNNGFTGGASNQSGTGATAYYGNRGGNVNIESNVAGGGGAGAAGTDNDNSNNGVAGGAGTSAFSSWGIATGVGQNINGTYYIAGGGAGGANASGGGSFVTTRSYGGGGINSSDTVTASGIAGTGSGGAGFSYNSGSGTYPAGSGGSGVVIVRYAK